MQDGVCPTCWLQDQAHTSRNLQNTALVGTNAAPIKELVSNFASALPTQKLKAAW